MNITLLREISEYIGAEPRRLQMGAIVQRDSEQDYVYESAHDGEMNKHPFPPCGTAACIAGTAAILRKQSPEALGAEGAGVLLGLTKKQQLHLFWVHGWPKRFGEPYLQATTPEDRVTIAQRYIAALIKAEQKRRKARRTA